MFSGSRVVVLSILFASESCIGCIWSLMTFMVSVVLSWLVGWYCDDDKNSKVLMHLLNATAKPPLDAPSLAASLPYFAFLFCFRNNQWYNFPQWLPPTTIDHFLAFVIWKRFNIYEKHSRATQDEEEKIETGREVKMKTEV